MQKDKTEINDWIDDRYKEAKQGLNELDFKLFMEVKIYLENAKINKNPLGSIF